MLIGKETKRVVGASRDSIEAFAVDAWFSRFAGIDRDDKVRCFGVR